MAARASNTQNSSEVRVSLPQQIKQVNLSQITLIILLQLRSSMSNVKYYVPLAYVIAQLDRHIGKLFLKCTYNIWNYKPTYVTCMTNWVENMVKIVLEELKSGHKTNAQNRSHCHCNFVQTLTDPSLSTNKYEQLVEWITLTTF